MGTNEEDDQISQDEDERKEQLTPTQSWRKAMNRITSQNHDIQSDIIRPPASSTSTDPDYDDDTVVGNENIDNLNNTDIIFDKDDPDQQQMLEEQLIIKENWKENMKKSPPTPCFYDTLELF